MGASRSAWYYVQLWAKFNTTCLNYTRTTPRDTVRCAFGQTRLCFIGEVLSAWMNSLSKPLSNEECDWTITCGDSVLWLSCHARHHWGYTVFKVTSLCLVRNFVPIWLFGPDCSVSLFVRSVLVSVCKLKKYAKKVRAERSRLSICMLPNSIFAFEKRERKSAHWDLKSFWWRSRVTWHHRAAVIPDAHFPRIASRSISCVAPLV